MLGVMGTSHLTRVGGVTMPASSLETPNIKDRYSRVAKDKTFTKVEF